MQRLTLKAASTVTDLGRFSTIAATWSVDRGGDQIRRGAFAKTVARWQHSGKKIPVHWNHSGEAADVIGWVDPSSMREGDEGLYVKGQLDLEDSETAREAWRSMKNNSVALSFGYLATKSRDREDGVRELLEIDLFEVSIVAVPMNADTRFIELKGTTGDPQTTSPDLDAMSIEELRAYSEAVIAGIDTKAHLPIRIASFPC